MFEWDALKEQLNITKHRLDFRTAARIFLDPFLLEFEDDGDHGESRWNVIGIVDVGCYLLPIQKEMSASVLFLHEELNHMNEENITIHFELDPKHPSTTDWSHFDAMTEQERHTAALSDPDSRPANEVQLAHARRVPDVRRLRHKLNLTQEQFAHRFQLSLGAVRDWEQGRNQPDHAARTLLRVIEFNPDVVEKALEHV